MISFVDNVENIVCQQVNDSLFSSVDGILAVLNKSCGKSWQQRISSLTTDICAKYSLKEIHVTDATIEQFKLWRLDKIPRTIIIRPKSVAQAIC